MARRLEKVSGHRRKDMKGKWRKVRAFQRKAKPKRVRYIKPFKQKFEVIYYRDDQGRIVSKRRYKRIK